jgi:alcohol dehydrogenase class IV
VSAIGVIRSPRLVLFGHGQRNALPRVVADFGKRVFICTDNRWNSDPLLQGIARDLDRHQVHASVYDGTVPELPVDCVDQASSEARKFAPDLVIGIGGGSSLDLAKLVALRLSFSDPLSAFYGEFKVPGPLLPLIAVPTTAGTGSEATPVAVVSDPERVTKVGISSPHLIPQVAICDPELTLSCPSSLTAIVGADALTHAIESFTAVTKTPSASAAFDHVFIGKNELSDGQAMSAIHALGRNLAAAVGHGDDRDARHQVMLGSLLAGQAFGVAGTAAAHAIQYPIGALTKTPHGLGVAALMPYVLAFNLPARSEEIAEIGALMGGQGGGSAEGQARAAITTVADLFHRIGIPRTLAELGLRRDQIDWVAEHSMSAARLVNNNPRLLDKEGMHKIIVAAFEGGMGQLMN